MNDEELKRKISATLDMNNLQDLQAVMQTVEGRRFFSWVLMQCGADVTSFTRDSRTYFNEGMRNVALILKSCTKAMGMAGVDLMQKAEKEYIVYQEDIKQEILSKDRKNSK